MNSNSISLRKIILIGLIGNVMEWYDFAVYGYFATVIGKLFFPAQDSTVSLIASFGAFAAGFLVRPLGGLVFGRIGDLMGRQKAMTISVMAMAVPTVLMGVLPTYESIGIFAPILLISLRIIQGMSVGGEFTSSLIFLVEHAPKNRRAFTAVWGNWGGTLGILLGSGVGLIVSESLDDTELFNWGWRLPFVFGGLVALTGWMIRSGVHVEAPSNTTKSPVKEVFKNHKWDVLRIALLNIGGGVGFYTAFVYAVSYIKNIDKLSESVALEVNSLAMFVLLLVLPFAALLSDIFGRKKILLIASATLVLCAIPAFHLLHSSQEETIMIGEVLFALIVGMVSGGMAALNVEMIHPSVRCTGLAFSYNASMGLFGGTTPLIATWLISQSGDPIAPAYWLVVANMISLLTLVFSVRAIKYQGI